MFENETQIVKSKLVTTIAQLPKAYKLSFEVEISLIFLDSDVSDKNFGQKENLNKNSKKYYIFRILDQILSDEIRLFQNSNSTKIQ